MKPIVSLVIAVFLAGTAIVDASAAVLRQSVTVESDVVRLGDLFADAGKGHDAVVAEAPAPGQRITINARSLQSIARLAGLSWQPQSRYQHATVTRAGRSISARDVESLIRKSMLKIGLPEDRKIALSKSDLTVHVAQAETREIRVVNARYNLDGKQFAAILEIPRGNNPSERLQVTGKLYGMVDVPVLSQRIQRGQTIRDGDVELVKMRQTAVTRDTVLDRSQIVGKTPRRLLSVGKPIRNKDLQTPILIKKGKLVTIVLRNRNILITAQGRALENGADGEVIRITNTRSRNTIQGVVVGPNRVAIDLPSARP